MNNIELYLIVLSGIITLTHCSSRQSIDNLMGEFYEPGTGSKLFEVYEDTSGIYTRPIIDDYDEDDILKLIPLNEFREEYRRLCDTTFEYWFSNNLIGGSDWDSYLNNGLIYDDGFELLLILDFKKPYESEKHFYNTGYTVILGLGCNQNRIERINVAKVE